MSYFRDNIEKLAGYTPGFQPNAAKVVKINTNENPYPPSPKVMEAIHNVGPEVLNRYPNPVGQSFREASAKVNGVEPENIMCTNGGDDLLTICIRSFCDESRPLVYPGPTYTLYPVLADIQNCKTIEVAFGKNGELPSDKLVELNAGLVIVCNPNAPIGSFVDIEQIKKLANRLKGKCPVLVDEAYADFAEDNCVRILSECENLIILRSMSKGYSLAGMRFGYAIANKEIITGMMKVKDSYNVDALAILAATEAMKDQGYFLENVAKIKSQRSRVTKELEKMGFIITPSHTNFIFAQIDNAKDIYQKLIEKDIYIRYFPYEGIDNKLRISIGTAEENDKLIEALGEILG